jgi:hypothetical protein
MTAMVMRSPHSVEPLIGPVAWRRNAVMSTPRWRSPTNLRG